MGIKRYITFMVVISFILNNNYISFAVNEKDNFITGINNYDFKAEKLIENLKKRGEYNSSKLNQKKSEIQQLKIEYKKKILKSKDKNQLLKEYDEYKDRTLLKIYSGIVKDINLKDGIKRDVKNISSMKLNNLLEVLKSSLYTENNDVKLYIKSSMSGDEIKTYFYSIDESIKINQVFNENNIFEINFSKESILYKDLLPNIDSGIIPEYLIKFKIIQPTAFQLDSSYSTGYLYGETDNLRSMKMISSDLYQKTFSTSGKRIKVGVIDTGIDYNHSDLKDNIYINQKEKPSNRIDDDNNGYIDDVSGYDFVNNDNDPFDDSGHGTHVSGILGASVNGKGMYGVNSNVLIIPLKVLAKDGYGSSYNVVNAIKYAADNGISVINMSITGQGDSKNDFMCEAINYAYGKGTISVVAAGNKNDDVSKYIPASCEHTITVGASDQNNNKSSFSNYGNNIDVFAPGVLIYSTIPGEKYSNFDGTSMATPQVTGLISAMLMYGDKNFNEIEKIITDNGNELVGKYTGKIISLKKVMKYLGVGDDSESKDNILPIIDTPVEKPINKPTIPNPDIPIPTPLPIVETPKKEEPIIKNPITNPPSDEKPVEEVPKKDLPENPTNPLPPIGNNPVNKNPNISYYGCYKVYGKNAYECGASSWDYDGEIVKYQIYLDGVLFKEVKTSGNSNNIDTFRVDLTKTSVLKLVVSDDVGGQTIQEQQLEFPDIRNKNPNISYYGCYKVYGKNAYECGASSWDYDGEIVKYQIYLDGVLLKEEKTSGNSNSINTFRVDLTKTSVLKLVVSDDVGGQTIQEKTLEY